MWPRSILAFLFLVIKRYIVDAEEKGGKAEFLRHFFVQDLFLWNKMSFSSTPTIGQWQFLRATMSLWMENATLNYCKITMLNTSWKVQLGCMRRVDVCGKKSIHNMTRVRLLGKTLNALIIRGWMPHLCVSKLKAYSFNYCQCHFHNVHE